MCRRVIAAIAWVAVALTQLPAEAATLIHAGRLIDVTGSSVLTERTIVVEGDRIAAIDRGYRRPAAGDEVIDLRDHTVMPGLMDMHTHLTQEYGPSNRLDRLTRNATDVAIDSVVYAERTLLAGFTVVRDLGDYFNASIALRNAVNRGLIPGPRIFTAGTAISTTGGHIDPTNGWADHVQPADPSLTSGVVDGPVEAAAAVRQRYKEGSDLIKIAVTGGVLSVARNSQNPQFMAAEIEAIVATARDYGLTVAVHAHGAEGMKRAIKAGVDTIEHGTYMDDEVIALMKQHGTWFVPTLMAGRWLVEKAAVPGFFPDVVRPKATAVGPKMQDTFARAYRAGVKILFGTDSGVSEHGDNAGEFALMVEAGMPGIEAIRSATILPAGFLGIDDRLGSLEPGKIAD
ncbi:MAG TPA: amidohydrolase family protein, partial [Steroidobacteraceae bacterium]|nr:amidohydrolase family protein [Steroidobacteraceae bacterium]